MQAEKSKAGSEATARVEPSSHLMTRYAEAQKNMALNTTLLDSAIEYQNQSAIHQGTVLAKMGFVYKSPMPHVM